MRHSALAWRVILLAVVCASPAVAHTLRVPETYAKIQKAVDAARDGDTVLIAPGLYVESFTARGKRIRVRSAAGAASTRLEPAAARLPVVTFDSGEDSLCVLEHLTLAGALDTVAVLCSAAGPLIQHCVFVNSRNSYVGAAIKCNNRSTATIRFNEFHHNESLLGAAVYIDGYSDVEVAYNLVHHNTGGRPGISVSKGTANIHHNILHDNTGTGYYWFSDAAIWVQGGLCQVTNNTLVRNTTGVLANYGPSVIRNNIIVSCANAINSDGSAVLGYNDVWNNTYTEVAGTGDISQDPKFIDTLFDFRLGPGSPCIDKGHPNASYHDPDGTRNDMGALPSAGTPPWPPANLLPGGDSILAHLTPVLVWAPSEDPDPNDRIVYDIRVSADSQFSSPWVVTAVDSTLLNYTFPLEPGHRYWWQVIARDLGGRQSVSPTASFRTYLAGDANGSLDVSVSDVVELVDYVYRDRPMDAPICAADLDASGIIGVPDIVLLVGFVFGGQPELTASCQSESPDR